MIPRIAPRPLWCSSLAMLVACGIGSPAHAAEKISLVVDTDIGSYFDDALALGLVLASPEVELLGVTTVGGDTQTRAWMVCRMLTAVERRGVMVAFGDQPQPENKITGQYQYRNHPAVIYNRTGQPVKQRAADALAEWLRPRSGDVTILALGPLTNLARLLKEHPEARSGIQRIVWAGGSLEAGLDGRPPAIAEYNVKADVPAARAVLASGVPLVIVPLDVSSKLKFDRSRLKQVFAAGTQLTYQLEALDQLSDEPAPPVFDAAAAALAINPKFASLTAAQLEIDASGLMRRAPGKSNAQLASQLQADAVADWIVQRLKDFASPAPAKSPGNISKFVERRGLPARVHAFEDYETDIERRWWMAGKAETLNIPPGSKRCCRGVLTLDFDDLQGDLSTNYVAVIFNPVPGPPMGKNTRLSFRYWLKGTDALRVQLYSLTNGYHRYLSVHGLPQASWQSGTVDMTSMRRPDGSGGPLAADERIDDIQFYVDPRAELLIDDVVLYDEAAEDEAAPFPRRWLYTGWFDTGTQGKEWPGDFAIVPHAARLTWKAAKSVARPEQGAPWIRLDLRGRRPAGPTTNLRFRYRLTGASGLEIVLRDRASGKQLSQRLEQLASDRWASASASFKADKLEMVDELQFLLPAKAELLLDDVLLYEPGDAAK